MRIFHAGGSPERERLVGLNGARTEIAREGGVITCVSGDAPSKLFDTPGARLLPLLPDLRGSSLATYYTVSTGNEERVAGYRARRIRMSTRRGGGSPSSIGNCGSMSRCTCSSPSAT